MTLLMALLMVGLFIFFCSSSRVITCYSCETEVNEKCKDPLEVDSVGTCSADDLHEDAYCYKSKSKEDSPGNVDIFLHLHSLLCNTPITPSIVFPKPENLLPSN